MVDANENLRNIQELKEELCKMLVGNPDLSNPEVLLLSKKIDELLNENDRLMLSDTP